MKPNQKRSNAIVTVVFFLLAAAAFLFGPARQTLADQLAANGTPASQSSTQSQQPAETTQPQPASSAQNQQPAETTQPQPASSTQSQQPTIDKNGSYTTKQQVALYIHTYGSLPQNFITKQQAQKLGWSGGGLEQYLPGGCIGGNKFGNYEGLLPEANGRQYTECDIDTMGAASRGAKRIVFSNDGLIYYTADHYETFELLYGEE